jgi:acetylornithine deacetylase/succinyl-diaminopimelate desuccinylase-like protein
VRRLQDWIRLPSIAAEDRGFPQGPQYMVALLQDAGFQQATVVDTDGKPGVFATLDAGAERTVGVYFMYDVKQFDPAEWSSPPLEAALVDKPGLGKVIMGRGAVNQKGPEMAFLEAVRAIRASRRQLPVNLVVVAEGEEEIGSPHIGQIVHRPEVQAALADTVGVYMPSASQDRDGIVTVSLGAKGVVEVQLTASGERWGRGPGKDVHSSLKAMIDSPAWRLVKALDTLVSDDGNTITIDDYPQPRPISAAEKAMVAEAATAPRRGAVEGTAQHVALDRRPALRTGSGAAGVAADGEHRGPGRRLHGAGRQDRPAPHGTSETGPAPGAGHDRGRRPRRAAGAPRPARLRRHRGHHERRL